MSSLQSADMAVVRKLKGFTRHPMVVAIVGPVGAIILIGVPTVLAAVFPKVAKIVWGFLGDVLGFDVPVWFLIILAILAVGALFIGKWVTRVLFHYSIDHR